MRLWQASDEQPGASGVAHLAPIDHFDFRCRTAELEALVGSRPGERGLQRLAVQEAAPVPAKERKGIGGGPADGDEYLFAGSRRRKLDDVGRVTDVRARQLAGPGRSVIGSVA